MIEQRPQSKNLVEMIKSLEGEVESHIVKTQDAQSSLEVKEELDEQQVIGEQVSDLRIGMGMTRAMLAQATNIPEEELFSIEMGIMSDDERAQEIVQIISNYQANLDKA